VGNQLFSLLSPALWLLLGLTVGQTICLSLLVIQNPPVSAHQHQLSSRLLQEICLSFYYEVGNRGRPHQAAQSGKKEVAELLLANKADVNTRDDRGFSSLRYAVTGGYADVVKLLLAKDALLNAYVRLKAIIVFNTPTYWDPLNSQQGFHFIGLHYA
jgi:hypothetical protein